MKQLVLLILDGWGYNPNPQFNAILQAKTPNYFDIINNYPNSLLQTSGLAVGLPEGQMGNSEVGHMAIGGGRVVFQELPKINHAIQSGELENNIQHSGLIESLRANGGACHILGLISDGGVHSHIEHFIASAKILRDKKLPIVLHAITDGRDTPPQSAMKYIKQIKEANLEIASICGRFYAMDRDKRWDRTELAYNAIIKAEALLFDNPEDAIQESYINNITDEFILPHVRSDYKGFQAGDAILMVNFRADRVRQLLKAFLTSDFTEFSRQQPQIAMAVGMTLYSEALDKLMVTLFPTENIKNTLGEVIAKNKMRQLRLAETEKYAHVTFFFNGGREEKFEGEDRILIPSPKVKTYDLKPEMSVYEITEKLISSIESIDYSFICVNLANADMVGHSGNMTATIKAIEAIDKCLGKIMAVVKKCGAELIITADHGNAELMKNAETMEPFTSHTLFNVPCIYIGNQKLRLKDGGLANVAPTILEIMGITKPSDMTAGSLILK